MVPLNNFHLFINILYLMIYGHYTSFYLNQVSFFEHVYIRYFELFALCIVLISSNAVFIAYYVSYGLVTLFLFLSMSHFLN